MKQRQLRIGLTGPGGTGKGTLSVDLHQALEDNSVQTVVIPSYIQDISIKIAPESLNYNDMTIYQKFAQQYSTVMAQYNAELMLRNMPGFKGFISERSILDYIPYFLQAAARYNNDSVFSIEECERYASIIMNTIREGEYTHLIVLPFEFENTKEDLAIHAWKERDGYKKKVTESCLNKMLKALQSTPEQCPEIIRVTGSPKERVQQCLEALL